MSSGLATWHQDRRKDGGKESTNLRSCALSSHRQAKRMASATVGTSLLQALDIVQDFSSQVILNLHIGEHGGQVEDLLVRQLADAAGRVDVEAGQEAR